MPVVLAQSRIQLEWSDIDGRTQRRIPVKSPHRSTGTHLSGVTKYVLEQTGQLTKRDLTDEFPLCMAVGMAWETWAVGLYPKMDWQPGEVALDGVFGSPDGRTGNMVEEFKATWKSQKTYGADILTQRMWMWQLMGYCKMLKLCNARMHVLWVNGEYPHGAPSPVYMTYRIKFTQNELDTFWKNIVLKNKLYASPEVHE